MKGIQYALMAVIVSVGPAAAQSTPSYWKEGTVVGIHDDNANLLAPVFFNTYTGVGINTPYTGWLPAQTFPRGVWTDVDISGYVPSDTIGVYLDGILIITGDSTANIRDLTVAFRPYGGTLSCDSYIAQTTLATATTGSRTNFGRWVPVHNGKFEVCWKLGINDGANPTVNSYPSYGVNIKMSAFARTKRPTD